VEKDRKELSRSAMKKISAGDTFSKLVGTELKELRPGFAKATLRITEHLVNVYKMAHGGAIFALADLVCEASGNSYDEPAVAVQTSIQYLAAGKSGDLLTASANLISRFDSFGMIEFEIKNQEGSLLSTGHQTVIFKGKKPE